MREKLRLILNENEIPLTAESKVSRDGKVELLGKAREVTFQKHGGADVRMGANHQ